MSHVVLANKDKFNTEKKLNEVKFVNSVNQITEDGITYVLNSTEIDTQLHQNQNNNLFIPSTLLEEVEVSEGLKLYFDLEQYPFFQKVKEFITNQQNPKGILRYRRKINKSEGASLIVSDVYVLVSLLGKAQDIHVKRTDAAVIPYHLIVTVNFGEGTMAHLEFTMSNDNELIEFEWSGVKNIIEFSSKEMIPIHPHSSSSLPLYYNVDSILTSAHKVDQDLVDRLEYYSELINGGTKS